eukprot:8729518-Lingulodinium_polyedra.AAC.1
MQNWPRAPGSSRSSLRIERPRSRRDPRGRSSPRTACLHSGHESSPGGSVSRIMWSSARPRASSAARPGPGSAT